MSLRGVRSTTWESRHSISRIIIPNQILRSAQNDRVEETIAQKDSHVGRSVLLRMTYRQVLSTPTRFFTPLCFVQNDRTEGITSFRSWESRHYANRENSLASTMRVSALREQRTAGIASPRRDFRGAGMSELCRMCMLRLCVTCGCGRMRIQIQL